MSSCSRYTTFFLLEVAFIDKTYLHQHALRSDLRTNLSLNADVSENTLPFVSQSINNLSDYDISQTHDWEFPPLSPHVLLIISFRVTPYHVIPCDIIPSVYITPYHISYHIISYHIISYHIVSYHIVSCHVMSCHVIPYHIPYQ